MLFVIVLRLYMDSGAGINVELVYVPVNQHAIHIKLTVALGATVADVLNQSGLLTSHPEMMGMPTGIFGALVSETRVVKSGDRVEIYRPLLIDPKEKRRQRAKQKK